MPPSSVIILQTAPFENRAGAIAPAPVNFFIDSRLLLGQILAQIQRNGHNDNQALGDVGIRRVEAEELQADFQNLKHHNADEDAPTLPTPPLAETPPMVQAAMASSS